MEKEYMSVSKLTDYIKKLFTSDANLKRVDVRGELSNFKISSSGHYYFSLKDKNSVIKVMMFRRFTKNLKFNLEEGMNLLITGYVDVYKPSGYYQLYANKITEDGIGDLYIAYEQLKKELSRLGWFDDSSKKTIPKFPKKIGVITASTGAAIKDIVTTIKRRWPLCEIILFPSLVQGSKASVNIVKQIYLADREFELDTLIVGRGGGSIEDLWPFNEIIVAKAIYHCNTPIISAVGHEINWTIADYVSDLRAPTPTAAAELAVQNINEIKLKINEINSRINLSMDNKLIENKDKFNKIINRNLFINPGMIYNKKAMDLDSLRGRLVVCSRKIIYNNKIKLSTLKSSSVFKNPDKLFENKLNYYFEIKYKLKYAGNILVSKKNQRLIESKNSFIFKNPDIIYKDKSNNYTSIKISLLYSYNNLLRDKKDDLDLIKNSNLIKNPNIILDKKIIKLNRYIDKLVVLDPLLTLKRGYSVSRLNGIVVSKAKDLKKDDELEIEFNDGKVNTKVL